MKNINLNTHFAQQVITAASIGCNSLNTGEIREARQLCGNDFWDALSKKQQPRAGLIISHAVDEGLLPVRKLERSQNNHQRYAHTKLMAT
jgi:hypothetical protein